MKDKRQRKGERDLNDYTLQNCLKPNVFGDGGRQIS